GGFKIALPQVEADRVARRPAPELTGAKDDAIKPLRLLAQEMGVGVRQHMGAMVELDNACMAADVARQARVAGRVDLPRANALADPEPGRFVALPQAGGLAGQRRRHARGGEPRFAFLR